MCSIPSGMLAFCGKQSNSSMKQADPETTFYSLSGNFPLPFPALPANGMPYSCGMDACEHEYESMSRHNRKVPTSFYHRFTQDACSLSERYAGGRIISVLEGGYSDRALTSATFAHVLGLADLSPGTVQEDWWSLDNLVLVSRLWLLFPWLLTLGNLT